MLYEYIKDYFVDDLVYGDTKVIFVLESPHTQEVKNGYPVAGKSGVDMSTVLFGLDDAFGKLVYEQKIVTMGIVNVCNYPLQISAYDIVPISEMIYFEKIRQNPKLRKTANPINGVIVNMMGDFKSRLSSHKDKKIVLCGNFASAAFSELFCDDEFEAVVIVPHPSFNNWKKEKYKKTIENLKEFVKC